MKLHPTGFHIDNQSHVQRTWALPGVMRERGVAMLLVLIAVAMATVLSMSFLASQSTTHGVAQNVQGHAQARSVAESALVVAIHYVQTDANWRTDKADGQWVNGAAFNGGTFDLYGYDGLDTDGDGVVDDTDGDLADDTSDPVTLKVVATADGVTHTVNAVVTVGSSTTPLEVMFVVGDAGSLTAQDQDKIDLMEGWGMNVTPISDSQSQANFDTAAGLVDVAYVAGSVNAGTVGSKLTSFTIGVVSDQGNLNNDLLVASSNGSTFNDTRIDVVNNTHYITSTIDSADMDNLTIVTGSQELSRVNGTLGSGVTVLATRDSNADTTLAVIDAGGQLEDSSSAAGRRVLLPWGSSNIDITRLNTAGQTILERSLRWGGVAVQSAGVGIAATGTVRIEDSGSIDSFDSSLGAYGGANVGSDATVATNLTTGSAIIVESGGTVNGSVMVGSGGDPGTAVSNAGTITGSSTALTAEVTVPSISAPGGMPSNQGDVDLSSGTTTYSSDQQFDDLTIDSGATLQISGDVTILVNGEFTIEDASALTILPGGSLSIYVNDKFQVKDTAQVNVNTADPTRLIIYQMSSEDVETEDSSHTYATVISPTGKLQVKDDSHFYGTFQGNRVQVESNGQFHQDIAGVAATTTSDNPQLIALYEFQEVPIPPALVGHWLLDDGGGGGSGMGYTTVYPDSVNNIDEMQIATQATLTSTITATSITAYVGTKKDKNVRYAIYDDSAGEPGNLVVESEKEKLDSDGMNWFTISIPDTVLSAGTYWLALGFDEDEMQYQYLSGTGQTRYNNNGPVGGGYSAAWGSSTSSLNRTISIYVNGGAPVVTDDIASNDGSFSGGATGGGTGNGDGGTAVQFDGVDSYIQIPHNDAYLLDDGSVSFWFKPDDLSGHHGLFSKDSQNFDTGGHLHIYTDGKKLKVRLQSNGADYTLQSSGLSVGNWYHVVVSFGPGGLNLYLDGTLKDSDSYTGGLGTSSGDVGNYEPIVLGANTWISDDLLATPVQDFFEGSIDDVRIYDQGMDVTQASNVYGGSAPGGGTGKIAYDTGGFGVPLDLDIQDTASISWIPGGGLDITSATQIISPSAATKLYDALTTTNEVSLEVVFTPANKSQGGPARIVSYSGGSSTRNFTFGQESDAYITRLRTTSTTSNGTPDISSSAVLTSGTQEHVIVSYDGENVTMYRNGTAEVTEARTGTLNWDNTFRFMFGDEESGGRDWLGTLHRVAVYDRAFNTNQANNVFGGNPPGDGTGGTASVDWVEP